MPRPARRVEEMRERKALEGLGQTWLEDEKTLNMIFSS